MPKTSGYNLSFNSTRQRMNESTASTIKCLLKLGSVFFSLKPLEKSKTGTKIVKPK